MKKGLSSVLTLTLICLVIAGLLGVVNGFTAPVIEKAEAKAVQEALLVVYPNGGTFEKQALTSDLPSSVIEVYKASNGGYCFKLSVTGYSSGLQILCGVDGNGVITGAKCMASQETLGYEKTYGDSFVGISGALIDTVDTVSGATKTTTAYKKAMRDALTSFASLNGK